VDLSSQVYVIICICIRQPKVILGNENTEFGFGLQLEIFRGVLVYSVFISVSLFSCFPVGNATELLFSRGWLYCVVNLLPAVCFLIYIGIV